MFPVLGARHVQARRGSLLSADGVRKTPGDAKPLEGARLRRGHRTPRLPDSLGSRQNRASHGEEENLGVKVDPCPEVFVFKFEPARAP